MRVLFISSGNSWNGISPIVKRQGESLLAEGIDLQFFSIRGKGFRGYLSNFGTTTLEKSNFYFEMENNQWKLHEVKANLEEIYTTSTVEYINQNYI